MNSNLKQVDFNSSDKLMVGVNTIANAVKSTLGPKGKNVLIQTLYGTPHVTKDGVTVANAINLEDSIANIAAQVIKQAAAKTVQEAGDGTTTAIVLAQAILTRAYKYIAAGASPILIKEGIQKATAQVVEQLQKQSKPIKGDWTQVARVAAISANNDEKIGSIITEALKAAGDFGIVAVKDSKSTDSYVTTTQGYSFDRGYASPYFVTNPSKLSTELENPLILITTNKIRSTGDILPALELAVSRSRPLLVIADDIEAQGLGILIVNKVKAGFLSCAVKAPGFGDNRLKSLTDLAILTGGTLITEATGKKLTDVTLSDLGSAESATITRTETTIINGKGDTTQIVNRTEEIKAEIQQAQSGWEGDRLKERLGKFIGSVAIINVGAATEVELKEKKDRIDDALQASKAAIEEGILPGGGLSLFNSTINYGSKEEEDIILGMKALHAAMQSPIETICANAGKDSGEVKSYITSDFYSKKNPNYGYNARTNQFEDLLKSGVIDPTKVVISALTSAASVASMLLMSDVVITDIKGEPSITDLDQEMPFA